MAAATSANPTSLVELTISCRNLRDADVFSKSDPICVVFHKPFGTQKWIELERSECIDNTLDPDFAKKFKMTYFFEEQQHLKFQIYDIDSPSPRWEDHDFLGEFECTLAMLVSSVRLKRPLQDKSTNVDCGSIIIITEELSSCKEELTIQFLGRNLKNPYWFSNISPFLEFHKANEDGSYTLVHRTDPVHSSTNPEWRQFSVHLRSFCSGDDDRSILVHCKDFKRNGSHKHLGSFVTNVGAFKLGPGSHNVYQLVHDKKKQRKGAEYKGEGQIQVSMARTREVYSFIDYIKGGTDLNAFIGIDFTASNGNPQSSDSLHYINPRGQKNQYQRAIESVVEIIEDYDTDKFFPVLGFGARMPPRFDTVSHLFYVNGDLDNPYCSKVAGVLDAYRNCIQRVQLYGPTNFAPIIRHVAQFASAHTAGDKYFILLMITDGIITDMELTKKEIVLAADLPLSIIIVGVGNADFEAMEELDGDVVRVSYQGKKASRDIVQFVPFKDFLPTTERCYGGIDSNSVKLRLAREVLAEVPDQFLSYMRAHNVSPGSGNTIPSPLTSPSMLVS